MIRNHPQRRRQALAAILSKVAFVSSQVTPLERLVAYRRLHRILEDEFDYLRLEELGRYWQESLTIVITHARPYSTSSSALRKRRKRLQETGYAFTIHPDNSVTVQVPVDFHTDELVQELYRNLGDFFAWTHQQKEAEEGALGGLVAPAV